MTDRSGNSTRIGVFGGTFDPVHVGHLRAAEEAREQFALSAVLFVPSAQPPHKKDRPVTPAHHRLDMVRKAVLDHPAFLASDVECRRTGASYSVETLRALQDESGPDSSLYFVLGLDAFLEITTWRSFEELFGLSHWIVLERPGCGPMGRHILPVSIRDVFRYDESRKGFVHPSGRTVFFRRFRSLEISGSEIRDLVKSGRSIRYLVPEAVEAHIRTHHLYEGVGESRRR